MLLRACIVIQKPYHTRALTQEGEKTKTIFQKERKKERKKEKKGRKEGRKEGRKRERKIQTNKS
jgi:hypothetical protein